jgi:hypothetical protein
MASSASVADWDGNLIFDRLGLIRSPVLDVSVNLLRNFHNLFLKSVWVSGSQMKLIARFRSVTVRGSTRRAAPQRQLNHHPKQQEV